MLQIARAEHFSGTQTFGSSRSIGRRAVAGRTLVQLRKGGLSNEKNGQVFQGGGGRTLQLDGRFEW
jgi:hypothetical protein